uniref:TSA: Wollemia nobilis Ref_Wollemi_Transcript_16394_661 transcribed RNA sequence n=1 Tax=Wollemia nobilis TaxID=56998 RepID=A0A0C9RRW7_9CONI
MAASPMDIEEEAPKPVELVDLLRRFLAVQKNRAEIYARLKRGFTEYLRTGSEHAYQHLCSEITTEFNDCSKRVIEMESILGSSDYCRDDLVNLLKAVQAHEKQKLHMTAIIQVLKKAGRPSERLVTHERCQFKGRPVEHQCVHVHEITEATGLEDAEADAEYDAALNEAIRAVQEAVTCINDHVEEIRYEIAELEARQCSEN